jgi:hypothetical protein
MPAGGLANTICTSHKDFAVVVDGGEISERVPEDGRLGARHLALADARMAPAQPSEPIKSTHF